MDQNEIKLLEKNLKDEFPDIHELEVFFFVFFDSNVATQVHICWKNKGQIKKASFDCNKFDLEIIKNKLSK